MDGPIQLGAARLPGGEITEDEYFGEVEVHYDYVEAALPFSRASPDAVDVELTVRYQGCKVDSICYPLIERSRTLALAESGTYAVSSSVETPPLMISEQDRLANVVINYPLWAVLGMFYGFGLLLAFTPCVLPMVPILSGIIAGQGTEVTPARGFALSLSYVMGMAVTYTGAGALAALAGGQVQAAFQQPRILTLFAGLFVVLAMAMFGAFELQMPAGVQSRLTQLANNQKTGKFVGVAIMGALSALIVTTCVAPPLVATLAVIGQSGDVARGSGALFALSLGMGSPLLVVGASAGQLLPKVGPWMNTVKAAFGVMMLGLAIWMMERVLPGSVTLTLWALLVFLTGVFLGAFEPLPEAPSATRRLGKGLGVLACLYGALMLIGVTLGGDDPLEPIPRGALLAGPAGSGAAAHLAFEPVESVAALEVCAGDGARRRAARHGGLHRGLVPCLPRSTSATLSPIPRSSPHWTPSCCCRPTSRRTTTTTRRCCSASRASAPRPSRSSTARARSARRTSWSASSARRTSAPTFDSSPRCRTDRIRRGIQTPWRVPQS